jgi:hypothetical protein
MHIKSKITGLAIALLAASGASNAAAPANSTITNTASLTYTGLGAPLTASVEVGIGLVVTQPSILPLPGDNTVAENASSSFAYTITAAANGPDQYNLGRADAVVTLDGPDVSGFTQTGAITSVTLGATALAVATAGAVTTITVPSDGTIDGNVNGISPGDTVVIGGSVFTVAAGAASVSEGPTTTVITLTTAVTAAQGEGVFEQQSFNLVIADVNTVTLPATSGTITTTVTITSNTTPGAFTLNDEVVTTVNANIPTVTFNKFVRNLTTGAAGTGAVMTVDLDGTDPTFTDIDYYPTGATFAGNVAAVPGDVLEYLIVANATGAGSVTGASVTDAIPPFTAYNASSTRLNGGVPVADVGADSALNSGLTINSFATATSTGSHAAGTLEGAVAPGNNAFITFQVTVQ